MQRHIKKLYGPVVLFAKLFAPVFLGSHSKNLKLDGGLVSFFLISVLLAAAPQASALTAQTITGFSPATPIAYSTGETFALSATGGGSGNPVTFASTTTTICTVASSTVTVLKVGTCHLTANQAGNANYSAAPQVTASVVVSKGSQTISFAALAGKTIGDAPFTVSATASSGLSVTFTSTTTSVCTVSSSTVTLVSVGTCTIAANQAGNTNFNAATQVSQSFAVAKKTQTISFAALAGKTIGDAAFAVSATASSSLAVTFTSTTTSVCTVSGATVTLVSVGTCSIAANQAGNSTYSAAPQVTQSFAVAKKIQSITFSALSGKTFGAAPFSVSATASSGLAVSFSSLTTSVCTVSISTVTLIGAGSCTIAADQVGNGTYSAASEVTQTFAVASQSQTITFGSLTGRTFGAAPFTVSATASSGLPITFASTTTPICTVSGSTVTLVGAGTCSIVASQAGNTNFSPAPQITQSFSVAVATQTITFGALTGMNFGLSPFAVSATASSGLVVAFTSTTTPVCTVSGSTVTLVSPGTCTIAANQAGNGSYSAAAQVIQSFSVSPGNQTINFGALQSKIFGTAPFTVSATASSALPVTFTSTTAPVCTIAGSTVTLVGGGTCSIAADQNGNGSYSAASQVIQSFVVSVANQTITFGALSAKTIGAAPFTVSATATSLLPVTFASNSLSVCTVSGSTVTLVSAGTCSIAANQPGNTNFGAAVQVAQSFNVVAGSQNITYIYDAVGRVIQVVASPGFTNLFSYDAVGNITAVSNSLENTLSITQFVPIAGPVGTSVTINGSGFDSTAANNSVTFNGTAAAVSSATSTSLVVVAPTGATTGLISLTNANGSATSTTPFTVGNPVTLGINPITINLATNQTTSFDFNGTAGQGYALGLTGFAATTPGAALNVAITKPDGGSLITCSVNSDTGCVLPYLPTSGKFTVTFTAGSSALTLSAVLNPDIVGALTTNVSSTFVAPSVGQAATYTFSPPAGQPAVLSIAGDDFPGTSTVQIYAPNGTLLQSWVVNASAGSNGSNVLTMGNISESYKVRLIPPSGNATGRMTITSKQAVSGALVMDSAPLAVTLLAGQVGAYSFNGTAGQNVGLSLTGLSTIPTGQNLLVSIINPDGSLLGSVSTGSLSEDIWTIASLINYPIPPLPSTGTYTVILNTAANSAAFSIQLSSSLSGMLMVDGAAVAANLNSIYAFNGTTGQSLGLGLTGIITDAYYLYVTISKPDGTLLDSFYTSDSTGGHALPTLPIAGAYAVQVQVIGGTEATFNLMLSSDTTDALVVNGSAKTFSSTRAGQAVSYTFNGSVRQNLNLSMTGDTIQGDTFFYVYNPNGTLLTSTIMSNWGAVSGAVTSGSLSLNYLPTTGSYKVRVSPTGGTGSITVALAEGMSGTLAVDGSATAVNLIAWQDGSYTFNGAVGQNLGLGLSEIITNPIGRNITVTIRNPDGSILGSYDAYGSAGGYALPSLPAAGTYTVLIDPGSNAVTLNLLLSSDAMGTLTANGSALTYSSARVGQAASYTFNGTAGQNLSVSMTGDTFPGNTTFSVYNPNGTLLMNAYVANGGATASGSLSLTTLPVTGNYIVRVSPTGGTGSVTVALLIDVSGSLVVDSSATAVSLAAAQSGIYTFSGTAGQNLGLGLAGIVTDPAGGSISVTINSPDGSLLGSFNTSGSTGGYALPRLPITGTYTVRVDPGLNSTVLNLLLSSDVTGTLTANGAALTFSPARAGQAASYTFNGAAGQNLLLSMTGDTFPGYTLFYVYKPSGAQLTYSYTYYSSGAATSGAQNLNNLPMTGSYIVRVVPPVSSGSVTIALTQ